MREYASRACHVPRGAPPHPNPPTPTLQSFLHCDASDEVSNGFYLDAGYDLLGELPDYYTFKVKGEDGGVVDIKAAAHVWARPFNDGALCRYDATKDDKGHELVNLAAPELKRTKRLPKWMVDCGFQFILPLCIVATLFLVSYALVLLGPLKGISRKYMKGAGEGDEEGEELDPLADEEGDL